MAGDCEVNDLMRPPQNGHERSLGVMLVLICRMSDVANLSPANRRI